MRFRSMLSIAVLACAAMLSQSAFAQDSAPAASSVTGTGVSSPAAPGAPVAPASATSPAAPAPREAKLVKARVLTNGSFGRVNDIVLVPAAIAKAHGDLDPDADAVAYAESLQGGAS